MEFEHCPMTPLGLQIEDDLHGKWVMVRRKHMALVFVEHVWNPLCTNLSFTQAVGEDTVNTSWRDSYFCNKCCA